MLGELWFSSQYLYIPRHSKKRFSLSLFFFLPVLKVVTLLSRGPILTVACSAVPSEKFSLFSVSLSLSFATDLLTYKPRSFSFVHRHNTQNL